MLQAHRRLMGRGREKHGDIVCRTTLVLWDDDSHRTAESTLGMEAAETNSDENQNIVLHQKMERDK